MDEWHLILTDYSLGLANIGLIIIKFYFNFLQANASQEYYRNMRYQAMATFKFTLNSEQFVKI